MMQSLILRFRDLNLPIGETIRRHSKIAEEAGHVWWGWMKRNAEIFPTGEFSTFSAAAEKSPVPIFLYDSGTEHVYRASLLGIYAFRDDNSPAPEPRRTPSYMSEADLPAWFKLADIATTPLRSPRLTIGAVPTLAPTDTSTRAVGELTDDLSVLRDSGATLWIGEVEFADEATTKVT